MATQVGDQIAQEAVKCLSDPSIEQEPGYCQRFVREVCERVGGHVADVMGRYARPSALETMRAFMGSTYDAWQLGDDAPALEAGDILYKGVLHGGPHGHTAIVYHQPVNGKSVLCVAENSTFQVNHPDHAVQGAKGWRTLREFGAYDMVVRLS